MCVCVCVCVCVRACTFYSVFASTIYYSNQINVIDNSHHFLQIYVERVSMIVMTMQTAPTNRDPPLAVLVTAVLREMVSTVQTLTSVS